MILAPRRESYALIFEKKKIKREKSFQKKPKYFLFLCVGDLSNCVTIELYISIVYILDLSPKCVISYPILTLVFHYDFESNLIQILLSS